MILLPLLGALLALADGGFVPLPASFWNDNDDGRGAARHGAAGLPGDAGLSGTMGLSGDGGLSGDAAGGLGWLGALTPGPAPAAEAWGRNFRRSHRLVRNASDVSDEELGDVPDVDPGRCIVDIDRSHPNNVSDEGRGIAADTFCFSYTDRAIVRFNVSPYWRDGTHQSAPYRAYVSTGREVPEAQGWHPNVQTTDAAGNALGRRGLAEYKGFAHSDPTHDNYQPEIILTRDMASHNRLGGGDFWRNGSMVFFTVYTGNTNRNDLDNVPDKISEDGQLANLVHRKDFVIKVYFPHEINITDTWLLIAGVRQADADGPRRRDDRKRDGPTPRISTTGHYHPHPNNAPRPALDRHLILNDYWLTQDDGNYLGNQGNSIALNTASKKTDGIRYLTGPKDYSTGGYWHPGMETTARLVFAPGSNLSGASGEYEETWGNRAWDVAQGMGANWRYLSGFNPEGPVRAELRITIDDGQGTVGDVEPFIIIIEGPPAHLYLTRTPTTRISGDIRYVQMQYQLTDRLGSPLTGRRAGIRWEGSDERSRAVIDRHGGGGTAAGGRFNIPITEDAPAGIYSLTLTAGDISRKVAFRVYDLPAAAPAPALPARITASAVGGGMAEPGGRVNFRYTLQDADGNPLSLRANPLTWSADAAGVVATGGRVDGARQNDGRFGFDIADDAAPGSYTITIRTVATDAAGSPLVSVRISFRVLGSAAQYAVAGPDQVAPGGYAVYTVTATDANGSRPNLTADHGTAVIAVSDGAGVRLFHLRDGGITLDDAGVGRFRLRADRDAAAGSRITITATSRDGAITARKTVVIAAAVAQ